MQEKFRKIKGFEKYYVSNLGNIKSMKGLKERILKPVIDGNGYLRVNLYQFKKAYTKRIHKLVAIAFLNHKPDGMVTIVDHRDYNILNNNADNLQLITQRKNVVRGQHLRRLTSNHHGIYWNKTSKKWHAQIWINGKSKHIGTFVDESEAAKSYQKNLRKLSTNNNYPEN